MEWEHIDAWHQRAKVPGGWLVKAFEDVNHVVDGVYAHGWDYRVAMCFVPDPTHSWQITTDTSTGVTRSPAQEVTRSFCS